MSSGFVPWGSKNSLLYSLYTDLPPPLSSCLAWTCKHEPWATRLSWWCSWVPAACCPLSSPWSPQVCTDSHQTSASAPWHLLPHLLLSEGISSPATWSGLLQLVKQYSLVTCSQAEWPPIPPVTPGNKSASGLVSLGNICHDLFSSGKQSLVSKSMPNNKNDFHIKDQVL